MTPQLLKSAIFREAWLVNASNCTATDEIEDSAINRDSTIIIFIANYFFFVTSQDEYSRTSYEVHP